MPTVSENRDVGGKLFTTLLALSWLWAAGWAVGGAVEVRGREQQAERGIKALNEPGTRWYANDYGGSLVTFDNDPRATPEAIAERGLHPATQAEIAAERQSLRRTRPEEVLMFVGIGLALPLGLLAMRAWFRWVAKPVPSA